MLYYPYKTMFSAYKSVIVSPCACNFFESKVTKTLGTWMSIFGGHFSALFQCVMTVSENQPQPGSQKYLYYIFIHSCKYTTFQIKTVFSSVLFSTEVHNPLYAHLLALSHIYIWIFRSNHFCIKFKTTTAETTSHHTLFIITVFTLTPSLSQPVKY